MTILATDKPEPAKAGKYTTTIKVTDIDGILLKPGKDYDKTYDILSGIRRMRPRDNCLTRIQSLRQGIL